MPAEYERLGLESGGAEFEAFERGLDAMKESSLSKVYQLLEPGPVVLLTTAQRGWANVMTMSWHMIDRIRTPTGGLHCQRQQFQLCSASGHA